MLMSVANGSIRSVVKNIDDYLIAPLGKAFFSFNMQFDLMNQLEVILKLKHKAQKVLWLMKYVVKD